MPNNAGSLQIVFTRKMTSFTPLSHLMSGHLLIDLPFVVILCHRFQSGDYLYPNTDMHQPIELPRTSYFQFRVHKRYSLPLSTSKSRRKNKPDSEAMNRNFPPSISAARRPSAYVISPSKRCQLQAMTQRMIVAHRLCGLDFAIVAGRRSLPKRC